MQEYTQLRLEYNRESNREFLKEKLGCACANCGSTLDVEYHHVVPLRVGGTNRLTNIVPLCYVCHQIVHETKNIRRVFRAENTGRPRKQPPENYKDILWDYVYGKIGRKECGQLLGLGRNTKIYDMWFYKDFVRENNIKHHKNKVDLLHNKNNNAPIAKGKVIAEILFNDGKKIIKYAN